MSGGRSCARVLTLVHIAAGVCHLHTKRLYAKFSHTKPITALAYHGAKEAVTHVNADSHHLHDLQGHPRGPHGHPHPPMLDEDFDGVDPLSSKVLSALRKMMHVNRQILLRMMAPEQGGRPGRAGVLRVLTKHEGISQRELADLLHLSPPTVTTMLQKMEQDALIERWTDETDQRLTRIRLTEEGRRRSDQLSAGFAQYVACTIGSMPEADRTELARLLDILADNTAAALKKLNEPAG